MTKKKKICCTFLIKILGFIKFKVVLHLAQSVIIFGEEINAHSPREALKLQAVFRKYPVRIQ